VNTCGTPDTLSPAHLTAEQVAFGESVGRLLASAGHLESTDLLSLIAKQGFLGIAVPEDYGGASTDDLGFGLVFATQAMAAGLTGVAFRYGLHAWVVAPFLARCASAAQQGRWLPGMASGACIASAVGLRESVDDCIQIRENDDGTAYLSGKLCAIPGAAKAQLLLIVITAPTLRVVVVDTADVRVQPLDDEWGAPGLASADITLEDLRVDPSTCVPIAGKQAVDTLRADYYLWLATLSVAGARAALHLTVQYVQGRNVFGRPLAEFENTRRTLANVAVELASAGALLNECIASRASSAACPAATAAAALAGAAAHASSVDLGLQLHGGYGYMREYPIAQSYADAMRIRLETIGTAAWTDLAAALGLVTPTE
jgi:alkylation response protein AidB-like acyl-CoA dehydrogenase